VAYAIVPGGQSYEHGNINVRRGTAWPVTEWCTAPYNAPGRGQWEV